MIIECINCNKKFDVKSSLIPENGRLLQCNSCNHKWFFKKEITKENVTTIKNNLINEAENHRGVNKPIDTKLPEAMELLENSVNNSPINEKTLIEDEVNQINEIEINKDKKKANTKNKEKYNILSKIIVFIITFVALIILMDTFQVVLSKISPNFEVLLYNLYETITDVILFFKDLI